MKIVITLAIVGALAALIFGYVEMSRERVADAAADQPITATSRVQTGANGETVIALDAKTQQLVGLATTTLTTVTLAPEIQAYGRVLDSALLISLHNDVTAAQAAWGTSRAEFERLKELSGQDNASARALEAAAAQREHDQGALTTAQAQLASSSSRALLDQPEHFFQSLMKQESLVVRLDLPADETVADEPSAARLTWPGAKLPVNASFLGRAASSDPQVQGAGFVFVVTNPPAGLAPGLSLSGYLRLPGECLRGVVVPDRAVVRADGRAWIYVQRGATNFVRCELTTDRPVAGGWLMTNAIVAGDQVVVTGAQVLLSEEKKSEIQMGD